jgi:hypothetical protein
MNLYLKKPHFSRIFHKISQNIKILLKYHKLRFYCYLSEFNIEIVV